jgi:hypothetical protein
MSRIARSRGRRPDFRFLGSFALACTFMLRLSKNPESPETWIHKPLIFHDRTLRKNQQLGFFDSLVRDGTYAAERCPRTRR